MKKKKKFITILSMVLTLGIFSACTNLLDLKNTNSSVTDINSSLTFEKLKYLGYMGGSVLYNPDNVSLGQLSKGVCVAVRLGHVSRTSVSDEQYIYTDKPEESEYGKLYITDINASKILFDLNLYDVNGNFISTNSFELNINSELDINGDNLPDLTYIKAPEKRTCFENAVYLNFISSQETLQTSMFSIITEQYENEDYPNGIIGINNDNKFIISEYTTSNSRSVVAGYSVGDYVLDSTTGKYKVLNNTNSSRTARSISENEMEYVEENSTVSYYFSETDFINYDALSLLEELPNDVVNKIDESNTTVEKLNKLLEIETLIDDVKQFQEIPITDDIYDDVIAQIPTLTLEELVQLNRTFLEETYSEVCPKCQITSVVYSEILPLVSVELGNSDTEIIDTENTESSRAAAKSKDEYQTQHNSILSEFNTFKQFGNVNLSKKQNFKITESSNVSVNIYDSYVRFGVKGNFSSSWGNLSTSVKGVVYVQLNSMVEAELKCDKNLISVTSPKYSVPLSIGPVIFNLSGSLGFDMPLHVDVPLKAPLVFNASFTGLYGAGFDVNLDYGVRWKKIWFIRYPSPYVNWNSSGWNCNKTAYYVNTNSWLESFEINNAIVYVNPKVTATVGLDIYDIVGGNISLTPGLKPQLNINCKNKLLTIDATLYGTFEGSAGVSVGIHNVPIIGVIGYDNKWDLPMVTNKEIQKWRILQKQF